MAPEVTPDEPETISTEDDGLKHRDVCANLKRMLTAAAFSACIGDVSIRYEFMTGKPVPVAMGAVRGILNRFPDIASLFNDSDVLSLCKAAQAQMPFVVSYSRIHESAQNRALLFTPECIRGLAMLDELNNAHEHSEVTSFLNDLEQCSVPVCLEMIGFFVQVGRNDAAWIKKNGMA